jgi:hypothetical protein
VTIAMNALLLYGKNGGGLLALLVVLGGRQNAVAQELPASFVGGRPLTVKTGARPLGELVPVLAGQSGLPLDVDKTVKDDKVTVRLKATACELGLRALAAAVDGTWKERRLNGIVRFVLTESARRKRILSEYRRRRAAAEVRIERRVIERLSENLGGADRSSHSDSTSERSPHVENPAVLTLLSELPKEKVEGVIRSPNAGTSSSNGFGHDSTPSLILPGSMLSQSQRRQVGQFLNRLASNIDSKFGGGSSRATSARDIANNSDRLVVSLWSSRSDVSGTLVQGAFLRLKDSQSDWVQDCMISATATERSLADLNSANQDPFEDAHRPTVSDKSTVLKLNEGLARYDRAMLAIADAAGVPLVADYFTKKTAFRLPAPSITLTKVMQMAAKALNVSHRWRGNALVVRSRDWYAAIDCEPAAEVVDRWETASQGSARLSLIDYMIAARDLADRQIATLANHSNYEGLSVFEEEAKSLMRYRHALRGYASLNGSQRLQTRSKTGLPVSNLSAAQRSAWKPALRILGLFPPEALAHIRIKTTPAHPIPRFSVGGIPHIGEISLAGI